jgi:hypothetical protein
MRLSDDELASIVIAQLTPEEREHGVVYALSDPLASGTTLKFPQQLIDVPWDALLAFIDQEPLANWGHRCRYVLVNREDGKSITINARFPPFRRDTARRWRIIYQAPEVPDRVLAIPKD